MKIAKYILMINKKSLIASFLFLSVTHSPSIGNDCRLSEVMNAQSGSPNDIFEISSCLLDEINRLKRQPSLVSGMIVLMQNNCPVSAYEDITESLEGRYIFADKSVAGVPTMPDGGGEHLHQGGIHEHYVSGTTNALGEDVKYGSRNLKIDGPHKETTLRVTGTAHAQQKEAEESTRIHTHDSGRHEHKRAGMRLCRVK